jgi:hypothetical protein
MSRRMPAAQGERDANHAELAKVYEEMFCSIVDTSGVGFGFPDAVAGVMGRTELVEFKTQGGELNAAQKRFTRDWRGSLVRVVRNREDVIKHVQDMRWMAKYRNEKKGDDHG